MRKQVKQILIWLFVLRTDADKRTRQRRIATIEELVDCIFEPALIFIKTTLVCLLIIFLLVLAFHEKMHVAIVGWVLLVALLIAGLSSKRLHRVVAKRENSSPNVVKGAYVVEAKSLFGRKEIERTDFVLRSGAALGVEYDGEGYWVLRIRADDDSWAAPIYYSTNEEVEKLRKKLMAFFNSTEQTDFEYDAGSLSILYSLGIILLAFAALLGVIYFA